MMYNLNSNIFTKIDLFRSRCFIKLYCVRAQPLMKIANSNEQMEYIKNAIDSPNTNWSEVKRKVLSMIGSINSKNFEGVALKSMVNNGKFDAALMFAKNVNTETASTLGVINGLLLLYYELGKINRLSNKEKQHILDIYKHLYEKYKALDFTTCERLLHALCIINDVEKSLQVLENICLMYTPSHSAYSCLIATLFKNDMKVEALQLIYRSLGDKRPLQDVAYEAWISYILRHYKQKRTKIKNLEDICNHLSTNFITLSENSMKKIKDTFESLDWKSDIVKISKKSGQCSACKQSLECLKITEKEFKLLQENVKEKLIVGSDLFLKTSPEELKKFLEFLEKSAPYDIVLDALNISFAVGKFSRHTTDRVSLLCNVVSHFVQKKQKVLLIGRKHMLNWPKRPMNYLTQSTCFFFTDNLSQDDPYFITAAMMSGSHTDFLSKDLLRGHRFLLKDEKLQLLFQRWQWQHQWMVFVDKNGGPVIQPPLEFTPCAQKVNGGWHLPYEKEDLDTSGKINTGMPEWTSWLCLQPR